MSWVNFCSRLFNPQSKQTALECEIEEELRFHMELLTRENLDRGMAPEEAAVIARQQFGNYLLIKAACYRAKGREMARRKGIRALKTMTWLMVGIGILIYAIAEGTQMRQIANQFILIALLSRWLIYLRSSWAYRSGVGEKGRDLLLPGEPTKSSR